jgi:thioredoxin-dependent peroxiredoxin
MARIVGPGDKAPDFALANQAGKTVRIKDFKGTPVVLYFYPKDDTSGCTTEACDFRDAEAAIKKTGAIILGVSLDGETAHQKFIAKYKLPFLLLCDENAKVSKTYAVYKEKNMYGRKYWGIERSTFVIDSAGVIKAAFRKVKVAGHAKEVLAALKVL